MNLVDTNILIYYLGGNMTESVKFRIDELLSDGFNVSVITVMEFLGYSGFGGEERRIAGQLIGLANVIYIDEEIVREVILMRTRCKIKLPDAIIAATAKANGFRLVTRNSGDFKDVVATVNPFED